MLFQRVPAEESQPALKIFRQDSFLGGMERWTFLMAAVLHVILFQLPWSPFSSVPRHNPAFDNTQLTWSGPVEDLPLLNAPREKHQTPTKSASESATPEPEAFHPRQRHRIALPG